MYNELYEAWKRELESNEIAKVSSDFYSKISDYFKKLREESRMLDKRTVKANLLKKEMQNAKTMIRELMRTRYKKLVRKMIREEKNLPDVLTVEEEKIYAGISPFADAFQNLVKELTLGRVLQIDTRLEHKRMVLRFLKDVPAIIGADMKAHGPFISEDIASVPNENAKILIKQGLAEKVEVN